MVYLLSEIRPPNCINRSVYANIFNYQKPSLVVNKVNQLEFYIVHTDQEEPCLQLRDSLSIDESILTIVLFKPAQLKNDWLLVLTESNTLFYIGYDEENKNFVRLDGAKLNANGQQQLLDVDPIMLSKVGEKSGYFLLHCFQGMIHLLVIDNDITLNIVDLPNKSRKRNAPRSDLWKLFATSIGNIVVHQMVILQNTNQSHDTLAVLYRDFQYNYSLRYYRIIPEEGKLLLLIQFEEFDEPPTCIIAPKTGGVLVLTSLHIFYFANPSTSLQVKNERDDLFLSRNGEQQLVVKKLDTTSESELISSSFTNYAIIDDTRILTITNTGMSFILYFNSELIYETRQVVNTISLIKLGMSTVASDVHYIDKNFFFASSKLSQSILFQVFQQNPFINICQFIPSSPPILNIDTKFNGMHLSLLTCAGGYDSGEFRKLDNGIFKLAFLKHFGTVLDTNQLLLLRVENGTSHLATKDMNGKINGEYLIKGKGSSTTLKPLDIHPVYQKELILSLYIVNDERISITGQGCYINDQVIVNETIIDSMILEDGTFVYITSKNEVVVQLGTKVMNRFKLKLTDKPVSALDLTDIPKNKYLLLVTFHDGFYELYMISKNKRYPELLLQEPLFNSTGLSSCTVLFDVNILSGFVWLLFLSENGSIAQVYFDLDTGVSEKLATLSLRVSDLPFRFFKSKGNNIFIANRKQVLGLALDKTTYFYKFTEIAELNNINSAVFLNDDELLISSCINELTLYSLKNTPNLFSNDSVIFSNLLNTKSLHIPNTDYSIVICFENKINPINDEYQKVSYIKLVDDSQMTVVDIYKFTDNASSGLVDICMIPSNNPQMVPRYSFVILNNSSNKSKLLQVFHIMKKKIEKLPSIDILGLFDSSKLKLQTIRPTKTGYMFIVGGNVTFVVELKYDQESSCLTWDIHPDYIDQLPIFILGALVKDNYVVLGDIMKGLYGGEMIVPNSFGFKSEDSRNEGLSVQKIRCNLDPYFLTSFDAVDNDSLENRIEIIFGDSLGNLSGTRIIKDDNDSEQMFAFNIGDQINIVKAIDCHATNQDFTLKFDSITNINSLLYTVAVVGTVNGGLYGVSRLDEKSSENIQKILNKCQMELVCYMKSLSSVNRGTKTAKYNNWLSRKDWKTLHKDQTGTYMKKEAFGMFDLTLIKKWLDLDCKINNYDKHKRDEVLLNELRTELKTCYNNKRLLQRLVYDSSLL